LIDFYTFCVSRNRKEYSLVYLLNDAMTSYLLRHIGRYESLMNFASVW